MIDAARTKGKPAIRYHAVSGGSRERRARTRTDTLAGRRRLRAGGKEAG
jgi:hypothetical protein